MNRRSLIKSLLVAPVVAVLAKKAPKLSIFWADLRDAKLRLNPRCQHCGTSRCLQVHHRFYRPNWNDTQVEDLETLCLICHRARHGLHLKTRGVTKFHYGSQGEVHRILRVHQPPKPKRRNKKSGAARKRAKKLKLSLSASIENKVIAAHPAHRDQQAYTPQSASDSLRLIHSRQPLTRPSYKETTPAMTCACSPTLAPMSTRHKAA